jgi:hypothetical protein
MGKKRKSECGKVEKRKTELREVKDLQIGRKSKSTQL